MLESILSIFDYFFSTSVDVSSTIPINSTPTLIASYYGKKVLGLNKWFKRDHYNTFYHNLLPFKVKEIISAGGYSGEFNCYWTIDDKLLFSGIIAGLNLDNNYLTKYNLTNEERVVNENMTELFEFKWKDFFKYELSNKIDNCDKNFNIKNIYALDENCIIIELDNNILFYYYLKKETFNIIPVNNVKWIKGGVMSDIVYICTNLNELFTFTNEHLQPVNLDFLQQSKSTVHFRLAAITNNKAHILLTEDNKIYLKSEKTRNGITRNITNQFEYCETPFEKESKIIDIKAGFSHFIVLLENGKVYSIGLNSLGQLGMDPLVVQKSHEFNQIVLKTREDIFVDKIFASSRGTVLRTDNEFIFLGEVIFNFTKKNIIPNITNSYILKRETNESKWNEISCGPWSYIVYYKEKGNTKDVNIFLQNLKNSSFNLDKNLTHDIEITW